ncbi:cytochrome c [Henriciella sp.]|uniref:c-type cytochrome n=1 Tax=Henriciella sp. TaxID=1968823 RepID=UPI002627F9EC|nr:cytochrome c [Henriciella sp.]
MRLATILLTAALCACSGPANDEPEATTGDVTETGLVAQGRQIAEKNCAECHALDATSDSTHEQAPPFRTLSQRYPIDSLQEALAEGIVVGHEDMPEFSFDPDDIDALIAFIESIQTEDG